MDNIAEFPNQLVIKEEAGAWLVRIDQGELTAAEISRLQEWASRSDFNSQYLEKLARNWDGMAVLQELADLFPLSGLESEFKQQAKLSSQVPGFLSPLRRPVLAASALAVFAVLISVLLVQQPLQQTTQPASQQPTQRNFVTRIGEQATFQLADGSIIVLNTNSSVTVDYSGEQRVVRLMHGEANFNVAKDPQRPFMVYAGGGMVRAVGTAFNVRYTSNLVDVLVTEGTVRVYAQANPDKLESDLAAESGTEDTRIDATKYEVIVGAGKSVQYSNVIQSLELALPVELEQKLAWQQGAIIFRGESLEKALAEIARYTDKELVIVDPTIKGIRVGGHFKTDDIDGLLATLSEGFNIAVTQVADNRIYLSNKKAQF